MAPSFPVYEMLLTFLEGWISLIDRCINVRIALAGGDGWF